MNKKLLRRLSALAVCLILLLSACAPEEKAVKLLSLLFSPEGQAAFITKQTPCVLSALNNAAVPEDALIYDAQQALWNGRPHLIFYTAVPCGTVVWYRNLGRSRKVSMNET